MTHRRPGVFFKGKCSSCKRKEVPVTRIKTTQMCGLCIAARQGLTDKK